jgi:hypothetical protein
MCLQRKEQFDCAATNSVRIRDGFMDGAPRIFGRLTQKCSRF